MMKKSEILPDLISTLETKSPLAASLLKNSTEVSMSSGNELAIFIVPDAYYREQLQTRVMSGRVRDALKEIVPSAGEVQFIP